MATIPPHLALRQPPPPPMPMPPGAAAAAALAGSPYVRSCAAAVPDENARKESVAESCCPTSEAVIDADGGSGSGEEEEEDGCESCVDGSEGGEGKDEEAESSEEVVWSRPSQDVVWSWSQDGSGSCFIWPRNRSHKTTTTGCGHAGGEGADDDPKAATARRQEEDRKFWEACLSSGYP